MTRASTATSERPQPVVDKLTRRLERQEEAEAAHPLGPMLHDVEGIGFTISARSVSYRRRQVVRLLHDAEHDVHLTAALQVVDACPTCRYTAAPKIRAAQAADEREDAVAAEGDSLVAQIHTVGKRLAGWVERTFDRLLGKSGGQP